MSKNLEELEVLEDVPNDTEVAEEYEEEIHDETIEKPKKKKVYNVKPKDPDAPKKERTPKQIEAWNKALKARQAKRDERAKEKEMLKEVVAEQKKIAKKKVEDKVVKKAISIKKKQIKTEEVLDEISDDETPYEEVKQIAKKKQAVRRRTQSIAEPKPEPNPVNPRDLIIFW